MLGPKKVGLEMQEVTTVISEESLNEPKENLKTLWTNDIRTCCFVDKLAWRKSQNVMFSDRISELFQAAKMERHIEGGKKIYSVSKYLFNR